MRITVGLGHGSGRQGAGPAVGSLLPDARGKSEERVAEVSP